MGELHLEIIVDRLLREFSVDAHVGKPQVAYKEAFGGPLEIRETYERQLGSKAMFAAVRLTVEPTERGAGVRFKNAVTDGSVPREFAASVERGAIEALQSGPLAGFPVVDAKVTLVGGSSREGESNDLAFKVVASMALQKGMRETKMVLLEPLMAVEIVAPDEFLGEVIGDLNTRRGRILGTQARAGTQIVDAEVPLAEMFGYSTDLRSRTQGRATHTMQFKQYETVPESVSKEVIARVRGY
jgi:elongation factor G